MVQHGRELVAEGFAEGGSGLHEDIVAGESGGDDFFLVWSGGLLVFEFCRMGMIKDCRVVADSSQRETSN